MGNNEFRFAVKRKSKIVAFNEKADVEDIWMNPGVYHLNSDIRRILPKKGSLESLVFPKLAKKNLLFTVKFKNALWHSIDSHKDIELCSNDIKSKKYSKFFKY